MKYLNRNLNPSHIILCFLQTQYKLTHKINEDSAAMKVDSLLV